MASRSNTPCWEALKFSFSFSHQADDWKAFCTRALDYLEALNINTYEPDNTMTGWKQLRMMFEGEDQQTLQTLLDNETIMSEHQKTSRGVLDTTATTKKSEDHFWHFQDELLLDVCQRTDEGIHVLNTHITTLVNKCKSLTTAPKRCSKLWSCNMEYYTIRPRTGYVNSPSPSLPTRPYSQSANSWSPAVRCFRRPRKRAVQSSLP